MGYESKFFAVKEYKFPTKGYHHSQIIAMIDVCKIAASKEFYDLFDTEANFTLWLPGCDENGDEVMMEKHEDSYGEPIKYCSDKKKVIKAIHRMIAEEDYWRFPPLLKFFEMFEDIDDVMICHYGY